MTPFRYFVGEPPRRRSRQQHARLALAALLPTNQPNPRPAHLRATRQVHPRGRLEVAGGGAGQCGRVACGVAPVRGVPRAADGPVLVLICRKEQGRAGDSPSCWRCFSVRKAQCSRQADVHARRRVKQHASVQETGRHPLTAQAAPPPPTVLDQQAADLLEGVGPQLALLLASLQAKYGGAKAGRLRHNLGYGVRTLPACAPALPSRVVLSPSVSQA